MNIRLILGALLGAALLWGMALVGPLAPEARGDFILWDDQQITVNTTLYQGSLYDTSRALIVTGGRMTILDAHDTSIVGISGGFVGYLYAYNASAVAISGGQVSTLAARDSSAVYISGGWLYGTLQAFNTSVVDISGGSVGTLYAYATSVVDISGGSVNDLIAYNTSVVDISGGSVYETLYAYDSSTVDISSGLTLHNDGSASTLEAYNTSVVTFHAGDFRTHGGLWLDGDRVLGTGLLTGEWSDGTSWVVRITSNDAGATIRAIPEPATLLLLALGGLAMMRRRPVHG